MHIGQEIAQLLGALLLDALVEDMGSIYKPTWRLSTTYDSRETDILFSLLNKHILVHLQTYKQSAHTNRL